MPESTRDGHEDIYISRQAYEWTYRPDPNSKSATSSQIETFHHSLPKFNLTPVRDLPQVASELGIGQILLKTEFSRLGLPAFKILGASWGVYRALCDLFGREADPEGFSIDATREAVRNHEDRVILFAATEGNHGRAVARMARLLLPPSEENNCIIYVPDRMYETTIELIEGEGAKVVKVNGDYDKAVAECWTASQEEAGGIMVQDNAFEGYEVIPSWIVEGYGTLLQEVDEQFNEMTNAVNGDGKQITHIVTPIGVGSLGHAVVKWAKDQVRKDKVKVITVEPESAACLNTSLKEGRSTTIETVGTIMSGMCCGTVSPISWKTLQAGVDCSVTVRDWDAHSTVMEMQSYGIDAGPCGAGCLAGLRKILSAKGPTKMLELNKDSVVVVLCTEGKREYPVPQKPAS